MNSVCFLGDLDEVRRLHALGEPLHYPLVDGEGEEEQPIHAACSSNQLAVVQWLHGQRVPFHNVNQEDLGTPMHIACRNGFLTLAQWLNARGMSLYTDDDASDQPIHCACTKGHIEIVQWLHGQGVPVASASPDRLTREPILIACLTGNLELLVWLHDHGAPLDCGSGSYDRKPVHGACASGSLEALQWLHTKGEPLDIHDTDKWSPFADALQHRQLAVVRWLWDHGVGRNTPGDVFATAYRTSLSGGIDDAAAWHAWLRDRDEEAAAAAAAALLAEEELRLERAAQQLQSKKRRKKRRAVQPSDGASTTAAVSPAAAEDNCEAAGGVEELLEQMRVAEPAAPLPSPSEIGASSDSTAFASVPIDTSLTACAVCWDGPKDHVFVPCGHMCACKLCAETIMVNSHSCPMCRIDVREALTLEGV